MIVRIEHTTSGQTRELGAPPQIMLAALAAIALIHPNAGVSGAANDALTWAAENPDDTITATRGDYIITIDTRPGNHRTTQIQPGHIALTAAPPTVHAERPVDTQPAPGALTLTGEPPITTEA